MSSNVDASPTAANDAHTIGSASYMMLALTLIFGLGFFAFPRDLVAAGPTAAWPSFAVAAAAAAVTVAAVVSLSSRLPDRSLVPVYGTVLGRPLGWMAGAATLVFDGALNAVMLREVADVINAVMLFHTPLIVLVALAVGAAAYSAAPGVQALGRSLPVLVVGVVALGAVGIAAAVPDMHYAWAIVPRAFPLRSGLAGAMDVAYVFFGLHALISLRPHLHQAHQRSAPRLTWMAAGLGTLILCMAAVLVFGVFSPWGAARFTFPVATAMRLVRLPGFFVDRFGVLVLTTWCGLSLFFVAAHLWVEADLLVRLAGGRVSPGAALVAPLALAVGAIAVFAFHSDAAMVRFIHVALVPVGIACGMALPVVVAVVAAARGISTRN